MWRPLKKNATAYIDKALVELERALHEYMQYVDEAKAAAEAEVRQQAADAMRNAFGGLRR
ncbi:MAG: hypothetical protein LBT14_04995 [Treponema sp.]|nr:hypothetical protein [Treponema sp.]